MIGILSDHDVKGHVRTLLRMYRQGPWRELWTALAVNVYWFDSFDLPIDTPDKVVWQIAQANNAVLITGNRNQEGPESLEATIRRLNTPTSLPVVTISAPGLIRRDRDYAERAAAKLLEYLLDIEQYRGVGRIYIP